MIFPPLKGWRRDDRLGEYESIEGPGLQNLGHADSRPARRVANADELRTGLDTLEDGENIPPQIPPVERVLGGPGVSMSALIQRNRPGSIELLQQRMPCLLAEPVGMDQQKIGPVASDLGRKGKTVVAGDHL